MEDGGLLAMGPQEPTPNLLAPGEGGDVTIGWAASEMQQGPLRGY